MRVHVSKLGIWIKQSWLGESFNAKRENSDSMCISLLGLP